MIAESRGPVLNIGDEEFEVAPVREVTPEKMLKEISFLSDHVQDQTKVVFQNELSHATETLNGLENNVGGIENQRV